MTDAPNDLPIDAPSRDPIFRHPTGAASDDPLKSEILLKQELTGVILRLLFWVAIVGGIFLLGKGLAELGQQWLDNVAMIITLTTISTLQFVIRRRKSETLRSFGPFDEIAAAINNSMGRIQADIDRRPIAYGLGIAVIVAVLTVLLKIVIALLLGSISNMWLAGGLAALVTGLIILPTAGKKIMRFVGGTARRG